MVTEAKVTNAAPSRRFLRPIIRRPPTLSLPRGALRYARPRNSFLLARKRGEALLGPLEEQLHRRLHLRRHLRGHLLQLCDPLLEACGVGLSLDLLQALPGHGLGLRAELRDLRVLRGAPLLAQEDPHGAAVLRELFPGNPL